MCCMPIAIVYFCEIMAFGPCQQDASAISGGSYVKIDDNFINLYSDWRLFRKGKRRDDGSSLFRGKGS